MLLQDGFLQGSKPGAILCRLDLLQRPHPLARWLGACGDAVLWVQTCCPPCFSFRCRSPGAHIACYFFTIHSYLLLSRSGRGSWLDALAARLKGQAPGCGLQPITSSLFTFTSYFYLAPPAGELVRRSRD